MPANTRARAKGRRGGETEPFLMLPHTLITHPSWLTLPGPCFRILSGIAAQYSGANNGRLALPFSAARDIYGVRGYGDYRDALKELECRGLIVCTRRGVGGMPRLVNFYALSWRDINSVGTQAQNHWRRWKKPESIEGSGWAIQRRSRPERIKDIRSKECKNRWTPVIV